MLRIRLRRTGAKKKPTYRVVVADARSPRDGAFLDILGHYNPRTEPSTVVIDADKAHRWLSNGAQPSDRVARLFKREGIAQGSAGGVATAEAPAEEVAPARPRVRRTSAAAPATEEAAPAETAAKPKASAAKAETAQAPAAEAPASVEAAEAPDEAAPAKRPTRRRATAQAEAAEGVESAADAPPLDSAAAKEEA